MDDTFTEICVQITAIEDVRFTVWLRLVLTDVHGVEHEFVEKAPVVLNEPIPVRFPHWIHLPVQLVGRGDDNVTISVDKPLGIVSADGETRFEVAVDQLPTIE